MRTAIVYQSVLGTTRRYAEWLHESVESDLFEAKAVSSEKLQQYDVIVLCTATYFRIRGVGYLKKRWNILQGRKVVLIVTGIAPAESTRSKITYRMIPEYIRKEIKFFKLPGKIGGWNSGKVKKENLQPVLEYIRSIKA